VKQTFWLFLAGRFIFGLGGETMYIVSATFLNSIFYDLELSMAIGFTCSFSYIFNFIAGNLIANVAQAT